MSRRALSLQCRPSGLGGVGAVAWGVVSPLAFLGWWGVYQKVACFLHIVSLRSQWTASVASRGRRVQSDGEKYHYYQYYYLFLHFGRFIGLAGLFR